MATAPSIPFLRYDSSVISQFRDSQPSFWISAYDDRRLATIFGKLLSELIARRGLSQLRFSKALGCGQSSISQVISGSRTPPLDQIDRWADILNLGQEERILFKREAALAHCPPEIVTEFRRMERLLEMPTGDPLPGASAGHGTTPDASAAIADLRRAIADATQIAQDLEAAHAPAPQLGEAPRTADPVAR